MRFRILLPLDRPTEGLKDAHCVSTPVSCHGSDAVCDHAYVAKVQVVDQNRS